MLIIQLHSHFNISWGLGNVIKTSLRVQVLPFPSWAFPEITDTYLVFDMRYLFCEIAIVSAHTLVSATGYSPVVLLSSLTFSNYCTGKTEQDMWTLYR